MFTDAVLNADSVLRVGLRARVPIPVWHSPAVGAKIVLLGDAAHPPVPYIGQGAMVSCIYSSEVTSSTSHQQSTPN